MSDVNASRPVALRLRRLRGRTASGFTLIELLITVVVMVVLFAAALPSFRGLIVAQRVRTTSNDLYGALMQARSEAMKRNAPVSLVAAASGWASGWTVQLTGGVVLLDQTVDTTSVTVAGPAATTITYNYTGRPTAASAGASFTIYGTATTARCISLALSGMPSIKLDSDTNPLNGC